MFFFFFVNARDPLEVEIIKFQVISKKFSRAIPYSNLNYQIIGLIVYFNKSFFLPSVK